MSTQSILFPEPKNLCRCGAAMTYLPHTGWFCEPCQERGNNTGQTETVRLPELFTLDTKGKLRCWRIRVERVEGGAVIITESGLADGKKIETRVLVTEGKNIGRSNETTPFEQANFDAKSKWTLQIKSGYVEDRTKCRQDTLGCGIPAPMLAQKYSPDGKMTGAKTLEQMKLAGSFIHVQPKFDGNRCLIKVNAESVEMYSRKGDRMLPVPHIEEQIRRCYNAHYQGQSVELILDGELYTDAFSFNALNGLLKREEKTEEHLEMLKKVNYHLYDVMDAESNYPVRYEILKRFSSFNVLVVPSTEIVAADENIRAQMEQALTCGYEGLMIRRLDTGYENKRSWSLCKYKHFLDEEYKLLDIIEDVRGGGIVGAFVLEMNTPTVDRDGREIKTFRAGIKDLTQDEGRRMLANKAEYIGRMATVEFFSKSEYQVPRFPKLKGFRADV